MSLNPHNDSATNYAHIRVEETEVMIHFKPLFIECLLLMGFYTKCYIFYPLIFTTCYLQLRKQD